MKTTQRIIKYFAILLAILIIISIVSALLFGLNIFSGILGLTKENISNKENSEILTSVETEKYFENRQINNMKIELYYANLIIEVGNNFHVQTNTNNIEYKQSNNQLVVKEKNANLFNSNNQRTITITIPVDTVLDTVSIEAGAGEIQIEKMATKNLDLEIGAGTVNITDLQVTQKAKIEGGAGRLEMLSGEIANLDLEMGIGDLILATSLSGNNKIDAGIGKLELTLTDGLDNYVIRANKGIGSIKIDGNEINNNVEYGNGKTHLKINGGMGSIEVK